jgi:very-short-patch-repair endonuclease/ribosomal protein L33
MNNQYKVRTIICKGCGKKVTKRMPAGRKYCSLECYRNSLRPQSKNGEYKICEWCGKRYYVPKGRINKSRFCSRDCANKWQARNKIEFVCPVCGKKFYWSKSRLKQEVPKYCSVECRDKDPNYKGHILGNLAQLKNKGLNKLEKAGKDILNEIGINYQEQVLIEDKFLVDVFIPSIKLIIQWDGDYWHGYGKDITEVDNRVSKRMKLDISQDVYMNKCGYKVIRFWEHEVYNERNVVIENIKSAIR